MYPLLETIRIEEGKIQNIDYHQGRINRSLQVIGHPKKLQLSELINVPGDYTNGIVKCRFLYGADDHSIHYSAYFKRKIERLHLFDGAHLQYSLKWANRDDINKLMKGISSNEDILIIVDGRITDTSYCNVAFKKNLDWITPEYPLLKGTQRALLLEERQIETANILLENLVEYSHIRLFNAMIPWDEAIELEIENILK